MAPSISLIRLFVLFYFIWISVCFRCSDGSSPLFVMLKGKLLKAKIAMKTAYTTTSDSLVLRNYREEATQDHNDEGFELADATGSVLGNDELQRVGHSTINKAAELPPVDSSETFLDRFAHFGTNSAQKSDLEDWGVNTNQNKGDEVFDYDEEEEGVYEYANKVGETNGGELVHEETDDDEKKEDTNTEAQLDWLSGFINVVDPSLSAGSSEIGSSESVHVKDSLFTEEDADNKPVVEEYGYYNEVEPLEVVKNEGESLYILEGIVKFLRSARSKTSNDPAGLKKDASFDGNSGGPGRADIFETLVLAFSDKEKLAQLSEDWDRTLKEIKFKKALQKIAQELVAKAVEESLIEASKKPEGNKLKLRLRRSKSYSNLADLKEDGGAVLQSSEKIAKYYELYRTIWYGEQVPISGELFQGLTSTFSEEFLRFEDVLWNSVTFLSEQGNGEDGATLANVVFFLEARKALEERGEIKFEGADKSVSETFKKYPLAKTVEDLVIEAAKSLYSEKHDFLKKAAENEEEAVEIILKETKKLTPFLQELTTEVEDENDALVFNSVQSKLVATFNEITNSRNQLLNLKGVLMINNEESQTGEEPSSTVEEIDGLASSAINVVVAKTLRELRNFGAEINESNVSEVLDNVEAALEKPWKSAEPQENGSEQIVEPRPENVDELSRTGSYLVAGALELYNRFFDNEKETINDEYIDDNILEDSAGNRVDFSDEQSDSNFLGNLNPSFLLSDVSPLKQWGSEVPLLVPRSKGDGAEVVSKTQSLNAIRDSQAHVPLSKEGENAVEVDSTEADLKNVLGEKQTTPEEKKAFQQKGRARVVKPNLSSSQPNNNSPGPHKKRKGPAPDLQKKRTGSAPDLQKKRTGSGSQPNNNSPASFSPITSPTGNRDSKFGQEVLLSDVTKMQEIVKTFLEMIRTAASYAAKQSSGKVILSKDSISQAKVFFSCKNPQAIVKAGVLKNLSAHLIKHVLENGDNSKVGLSNDSNKQKVQIDYGIYQAEWAKVEKLLVEMHESVENNKVAGSFIVSFPKDKQSARFKVEKVLNQSAGISTVARQLSLKTKRNQRTRFFLPKKEK